MVARSMAAFLSVQVPMEDQIRLKPGSELHLTPKAQQVSIYNEGLEVCLHIFPRRQGVAAVACTHHDMMLCGGSTLFPFMCPTYWKMVSYAHLQIFASSCLDRCYCHCRKIRPNESLSRIKFGSDKCEYALICHLLGLEQGLELGTGILHRRCG